MNHGCEFFEELIFSMPDAGLTDAEADELRAHLRACPDCRRLFHAFADVTEILQSDTAEAPAGLAEGAMARIRAYEKLRTDASVEARERTRTPVSETAPEAEDMPISIRRAKSRGRASRRWVPIAAAACLVVVIGGAAAVSGLFGPKGSSGAAQESIVMEAAAEVPAPMAEEVPAMDGAPLQAEPAAAAEAPAAGIETEEAETAVADMEMTADAAAKSPVRANYTWEDPAQVPEGREADFEKLIRSAAADGELSLEDFHLTAAVEYHGVIYEFLTDDDEALLLWQDAAESTYPVLSPGTVADLWDIIG